MEIVTPTTSQFKEYLALADQEIRPPGAPTSLREDFPLLLGDDNRQRVLVGVWEGRVVAGAACLVRQFQTSCGAVPVGGIGAVVTSPEFRGRGLSRAVQDAVVDRLEVSQVPLAVLWTDQPEIYAGRGFVPAGWEFHVDLDTLDDAPIFPSGYGVRHYEPGDAGPLSILYDRHPYRTIRREGDASRLYDMPGTRGLVAEGEDGQPAAWLFCGKGSDFSQFILEWGGPLGLVIPLLSEARQRGWARHLLVPPGGELLAEMLARQGAPPVARMAGTWKIVQPDQLAAYLQASGHGVPIDVTNPADLLGTVDSSGVVAPGSLTVAVWGFDSV